MRHGAIVRRKVDGRRSALCGAMLSLGAVSSLGAAALSASATPSLAQEGVSWPAFETTTPVKKEFRALKHYNFRIRSFSPSVVVESMEAPAEFHDTPEAALRAHVSAMRAGDYEWWLATLDQATQAMSQGADELRGVSIDDRISSWAARFENVASVTMEDWIETGRFIVITLRMHAPDGSSDPEKFAIPLSIRDGQWLVTGMLGANDPVLTDYDHPGFNDETTTVEIERIVRTAQN